MQKLLRKVENEYGNNSAIRDNPDASENLEEHSDEKEKVENNELSSMNFQGWLPSKHWE